jgi:hypothetical protein
LTRDKVEILAFFKEQLLSTTAIFVSPDNRLTGPFRHKVLSPTNPEGLQQAFFGHRSQIQI